MTEYFIIIGAQRSGTTYLYDLLDQHPAIEMAKPMRPEPKFFLRDDCLEKGADYYRSAYFQTQSDVLVRGEKSTAYMDHPDCAGRIAAVFPQAKIIAILRNPVFRAISNYRFSVENGHETLDIEAALGRSATEVERYDSEAVSGSPFAYLKRGLYAEHLEPYLRVFPRDRVGVFIYEDITGTPDGIRNVYRFLGVDERFEPVADQAINRSNIVAPTYVSESLLEFLTEYYREPNEALFAQLGAPVEAWNAE